MNDKQEIHSVEDYFNAQPEKGKEALLLIRQCILAVVPEAEERVNYNIPAYALIEGGKREQQIMIAGYENHVGFYPHPTTMEKFENELKDYKRGKGSVQFPLDKPLPTELIRRMVEYRFRLLVDLSKD
jgi:uncharacterized protein YdhG (YjbR/CyaY superfamily)